MGMLYREESFFVVVGGEGVVKLGFRRVFRKIEE